MTSQTAFSSPENHFPRYSPSREDIELLNFLNLRISGKSSSPGELSRLFAGTSFPQKYERIILILYAPGHKRILISRGGSSPRKEFSFVFERLLLHPRRVDLGKSSFRLQMDFILERPVPVNFYRLRRKIGHERHFEIGVDGLLFTGPDKKMHLFPPGDAYVRSIMGLGQLRDYLHRVYGEKYLRGASFQRVRSQSFLSGQGTWIALYRGLPRVGSLSREKVEQALELAIGHIQKTQEKSGKFLYYYDAALNSRRDHEHPKRDPQKNPYYNILRHCGGALTCLFYEKHFQQGRTLENITRAIHYLLQEARIQDYHGRQGAYIYSEKKAKLGGSGIALYLLAEYQLLSGDEQYRVWADRLAWHLVNQITSSGEFIYYSIYLDKPVTEADNHKYFSFYYPGEAVCGLAKYLHLADYGDRQLIMKKLRKAMEFLLDVRPETRASEYTSLPSDSWLMMGIREMWDFSEMRDQKYADFVFRDAGTMVEKMYKVTDAPYPDYAGAFYYDFGDYPYADGARCEGLLGAYELAVKMNDQDKQEELWPAIRLAAWSLMLLVNTRDAVYSAPNPSMALGGIRFKYTRQWFRIDTIQHVASFFAKMLPYWEKHKCMLVCKNY